MSVKKVYNKQNVNSLMVNRLNQLVKQSGKTQQQVSNDIKNYYSQVTIQNILAGTRHPDMCSIMQLSKLFNVTVDYLMGIVDDASENATVKQRIEKLFLIYLSPFMSEQRASRTIGLGDDYLRQNRSNERNAENMKFETAEKIANYFDVDIDWLTNGRYSYTSNNYISQQEKDVLLSAMKILTRLSNEGVI